MKDSAFFFFSLFSRHQKGEIGEEKEGVRKFKNIEEKDKTKGGKVTERKKKRIMKNQVVTFILHHSKPDRSHPNQCLFLGRKTMNE